MSKLLAAGFAAGLMVKGTIASAITVNPIVNGDFEAGNTGFQSQYTNGLLEDGPHNTVATYNVSANQYAATGEAVPTHGNRPVYGDHTTGSGLAMFVNGYSTREAGGTPSTSNGNTTAIAPLYYWSQTVSVMANTNYVFSLWGMLFEQGVSHNSLYINDEFALDFDIAPPHGIWNEFTYTFNTGAETSINLALFVNHGTQTGNDFAIDDIRLTQVPSQVPLPAGLPLLASALAAIGLTRRRRK